MVTYGRWLLTRSGRYERVDCINLINRVITVFKTKIVQGSFDVARSMRSYLLSYFNFYRFYHLSVFFIIHAAIFLNCFLCKYFRVLVCVLLAFIIDYIYGSTYKNFLLFNLKMTLEWSKCCCFLTLIFIVKSVSKNLLIQILFNSVKFRIPCLPRS